MGAVKTEREKMSPRDREKRDRRLIAAVLSGVRVRDIEDRFGVTNETLWEICRAYGVERPKVGNRL